MKFITLTKPQSNLIGIGVICVAFCAMVYVSYIVLPVHEDANPPATWGFSVDWKGCIRPDILILLSGHSPYSQGCGLNPPWTYILLSPLALLQPALGGAVIFTLTYLIYGGVLYRAGAKPWMILGIILSPFVYINAYNGNIDWIPVMGFVLPPQVGLFFVIIKPQLGAGIALFWLVEAWRLGRVREIIRVFLPVTLAYLVSFILFGLWPIRISRMMNDPFNASLWPLGLFAGIPLLIYSLYTRKKYVAVGATPLLAPYVNIHSYAILLFSFIPYDAGFILMTALSWLVMHY